MTYTPKYISIIEKRRQALAVELNRVLVADRTFVWEVGCGHGHFLTAYAAAHPEKTCVGIDLIGERIARATKKRDRSHLENLFFVQAEARLFLETLPSEARIETVFVLFPDPWPKLRHNKHRIIQAGFLTGLASVVIPDCPLLFRTDFKPYYEAAYETIASHPRWRVAEEPWPFEYATVFQEKAASYYSLVGRCKTLEPEYKIPTQTAASG